VRELRDTGVTIILTTHYIDEAEELADRIGVMRKGELILVEDKADLMHKLGKKQATVFLRDPLERLPDSLAAYALDLSEDGRQMTYTYDTSGERQGIRPLLQALETANIPFVDLETKQSSLEEIFVDIVQAQA
jgi:ABC-2 type transport system ATP-binding protein